MAKSMGLQVDEMTVAMLKMSLAERGLSTVGQKAELKMKLAMAILEENKNDNATPLHAPNIRSGVSGEDAEVIVIDRNQCEQRGGRQEDRVNENENRRIGQQADRVVVNENHGFGQQFSFRDVEESLERFTGDDMRDVNKWIREFEETSEMLGWNDLQRIIFARRLLNGSAKLFIASEGVIRQWRQFRELLIGEFGVVVNSKIVHSQLMNRYKKDNETFRQYVYAMIDIAGQAQIEEEVLVSYVVDGIRDSPINKMVLYEAETMEQLKAKLKIYERMKSSVHAAGTSSNSGAVKLPKSSVSAAKPTALETHEKLKKCFICGATDHVKVNCPNVKCFKCQMIGHKSTNCPRDVQVVKPSVNEVKFTKLTKEVKIAGKTVIAMVDSGASVSLMRLTTYVQLGLNTDLAQSFGHVEGIGANKVPVIGEFKAEIEIDGDVFVDKVLVLNDKSMNNDMIIGLTVTDQAVLTIDSLRNTVFFVKHAENEVLAEVNLDDSVLLETTETSHLLEIMEISVDENECMDVPFGYEERVKSIVDAYKPAENGKTPIETKTVLSSEMPIFQRPRRLAPMEKLVVSKQIEEWLRDGVIRESYSEFASPVVVVKKKNGSHRVCIDYRRLNSKIIRDRFPMPIIEDEIDKLTGARVFTVLDLRNGFFHVPVNAESVKYTSFVTYDGQYEFLKTPFGLSVSPTCFLRYVQYVFKSLVQQKVVITYMDDLIIPAIDEDDGIQKLKLVLDVASVAGLQISWEKCKYLQKQVEFLGYQISAGSLKPSPKNVASVRKFPEPKTVEEVQRFLGMCGYFRKFVQGFALVAKPLTNLTKKDQVFCFGIKEKVSFEHLKDILCSDPVLKIFDSNADTELHTDASQEGYGAVLLQKAADDSQWHPVYFLSKQTTAAEKKYHSYELEMLAIVYAFQKLRVYLLGLKVIVVTDCASIKSTIEKVNPVPRVSRWIMQMQEYDYTVVHRAGVRMRHVDALSRVVMQVDNRFLSVIKERQRSDEQLVAIVKILEDKPFDDYVMRSEVLMRMVNGKQLLVVPNSMQLDILRKVHDNGHFCAQKMKDVVEQDYYIPKLSAKIDTIVKSCVPCILAERKRGKREGLLRPIPKEDAPLLTYHIDFLGPLELTCKKYKHLFVVVDAFTKFVWIYAVKSTAAKEVIDCLGKQQQIFGNPKRIVSDRGSAFTGNDFKDYCEQEGIEHVLVTTGVPRGNGQVERVNQVIIPLLTKLSGDKPEKWYKHVQKVQQCINSHHQRSVDHTPFELMVGVKMRQQEDVGLLKELDEELANVFIFEREQMRLIAKQNIERAQEQQRQYYDRKCKTSKQYRIGDIVAIERTQFGPGLKLKGKFLGPYSVVETIGRDRYRVRKIGVGEGPSQTSSEADLMKPWNGSEQSSEADDMQDGRVG